MNYQYLRKATVGILMFGASMAPLAHAANNNGKSPSPPKYKKGALCEQYGDKDKFTCRAAFGNKVVSVEEIYKHGWRVVAIKPNDPGFLFDVFLFIEEQ